MASQNLRPLRNLREATYQIEHDLQNGLFTPFLGAGASSLRPKLANLSQFPWKQVAQTMAAIRTELQQDKRSVKYLQSFARQRLGMGPEDIERYIPTDEEPDVDPLLQGHRLAKLQAALVKATVRLTYYFGQRFSDDTPSIHRLQEAWVPFSIEDPDAVEAISALFDGADLTRELRQKDRESPFLIQEKAGIVRELQIQRIRDKLLILILTLISRDHKAFQKRLDVHSRILKRLSGMLREEHETDRHLRLDAVQWLSELIWYTLRYWVPRYPTTAELAFELSLGVKYGTARRAELAQAAEALALLSQSKVRDLDWEIQMLIRYCEAEGHGSLDREASAFFYAIAAAVQHEFDLYMNSTGFSPDPAKRFKSKASQAHNYPLPIVFTTNFDQSLERIFRNANLPYHVVFPVTLSSEEEDEEAEDDGHGLGSEASRVVWMLRTYFREEDQIAHHDKKWETAFPNGEPAQDFVGPIIVKLHGSPSEPKPVIEGQPWRHWLVLSEGGYLQAMSDTHRMPAWLGDELHASYGSATGQEYRSVWFLGYSLSDWNVRLHLYQHGRQALGPRNAVDRDADIYRRAILSNLDVDQWLGDLGRLPVLIDSVLDDNTVKTSDEVDMLVKKLRKFLCEVDHE